MSLSATIREAIQMRESMKASGATSAELDAGFEQVVRSVWPFTREWKYLCQTCRDYGLEMHDCPGDATCGRPNPHAPHEFGKACWCSAGSRFREKAKPEPSEFTQAGKTPKRGPVRFGR